MSFSFFTIKSQLGFLHGQKHPFPQISKFLKLNLKGPRSKPPAMWMMWYWFNSSGDASLLDLLFLRKMGKALKLSCGERRWVLNKNINMKFETQHFPPTVTYSDSFDQTVVSSFGCISCMDSMIQGQRHCEHRGSFSGRATCRCGLDLVGLQAGGVFPMMHDDDDDDDDDDDVVAEFCNILLWGRWFDKKIHLRKYIHLFRPTWFAQNTAEAVFAKRKACSRRR